jgi:hypothetical protein
MDQLLHRADRALGVALVVLAHQHQLAAVDATGGVDLVIQHLDAVERQLAVEVARPGERAEAADLDGVLGNARHALGVRAGGDADRKQKRTGESSQR